VFSRESRRTRRSRHDRSRPSPASLEVLEARELLAYNPLGFTLPDLSVQAYASTAAAWGNDLTVTVTVRNTGASTITEPLNQQLNATSSASSPATVVDVFGSTSKKGPKNPVLLGTVPFTNGVAQNSVVQLTETFALPSQPAGFPGDGGKIYLYFVVNPDGSVLESDTTNNMSGPVPLLIEVPLPELAAVGFDVPSTMQPGDTIVPTVRVGNFGTVASPAFTVWVVASTTPTFNAGSQPVEEFTFPSIPAISDVTSKTPVFNDANLDPQTNIVTLTGIPATLSLTPGKYYLGVVVDPGNQVKQIGKVPQFVVPKNPFTFSHLVKQIPGLPPAGEVTAGGASLIPVFPNPAGGVLVGADTSGTFPALINQAPGYGLNPVSAGSHKKKA
jgi:CARDB